MLATRPSLSQLNGHEVSGSAEGGRPSFPSVPRCRKAGGPSRRIATLCSVDRAEARWNTLDMTSPFNYVSRGRSLKRFRSRPPGEECLDEEGPGL